MNAPASARSLALIAISFVAIGACSSPLPLPPRRPPSWVVDATGTLDDAQVRRIDTQSDRLFALRSVRLGVALIRSTNNQPIERIGDELYHRWRMHEINNGAAVLLVVATDERKNRIVVGQALFRELPDPYVSSVLAGVFRPRARNGGVALATLETVDRLTDDLEHPRQRPSEPPRNDLPFSPLRALLGLVAAFATAHAARWLIEQINREAEALSVEWGMFVPLSSLAMLIAAWAPARWKLDALWPINVCVAMLAVGAPLAAVIARRMARTHVAQAKEAAAERAVWATPLQRAFDCGLVESLRNRFRFIDHVSTYELRKDLSGPIHADYAESNARTWTSESNSFRSALIALVECIDQHGDVLRRELAETRETLRSIHARHTALRESIDGLSPPITLNSDGITDDERAALDAIPKDTLRGRALFDALCTARELIARAKQSGADCERFDKSLADAKRLRDELAADAQRLQTRVEAARASVTKLRGSLSESRIDELIAMIDAAAKAVVAARAWLAKPPRPTPESMSEALSNEGELREQDQLLGRGRTAIDGVEIATAPPSDYAPSSYDSGSSSYSSYSSGDSSSSSSYDSYSGGGGGSDTSGASGDW